MQARDGNLLLSPSDVNNFLACEHRTALDLLRARGKVDLRRIPRPDAELIAERGRQHEAAFLERLRAQGRDIAGIGLITPLAAALLMAVMTLAIAIVHWRHGPWVAEGGWEYSVVLIAVAFAVTAVGPGKYSLDRALELALAGVDWALIALGAGVVSALVVAAAARVQAADTAGPRPAGA
jgi:hypothetical protein